MKLSDFDIGGFKWYYFVALIGILGIVGIVFWLYKTDSKLLSYIRE